MVSPIAQQEKQKTRNINTASLRGIHKPQRYIATDLSKLGYYPS
jgi:hypothetical protein